MYIVIFCSLLALLFTYLETTGQFKRGMLCGFILVTFLQVIKFDYGNDYLSYYNEYLEIIQYEFNWQKIIEGTLHKEPGWALLFYFFKPFGDYGFFLMEALISIFQGVVIYKFIRRYVTDSKWPFAIAIYLFATSYYLMSFSMLRQSLVMTIFFALWPMIEQRKFIIPLIILYLCSFIHSSSIILLPFAFWGFIPLGKHIGRIFTIIYLTLFLALFIYKDFLNEIFSYVMMLNEDMETYQRNYEEENRIVTGGIGFILNLIPLYIALRYIANPQNSHSYKLLVALSSIGFIFLPFGQIIQLIGRVGLYFSIFSILTIPLTYSQIKNNVIRVSLTSIYVVILISGYIGFFRAPVWAESFGGDFNTIFSVIF